MLTFHNNTAIKDALLQRIAGHEEADTLRGGVYFNNGGAVVQVCAVGCAMVDARTTLDSHEFRDFKWHEEQATRWGIPAWLGKLEDNTFERLEGDDQKAWPRRLISAIPVGADISPAMEDIALARLRQEVPGLIKLCPEETRPYLSVAYNAALMVIAGGLSATTAIALLRNSTHRLRGIAYDLAFSLGHLPEFMLSDGPVAATDGICTVVYDYCADTNRPHDYVVADSNRIIVALQTVAPEPSPDRPS